MDRLSIERIYDPGLLADLTADAMADGRRMVERLMREWEDGRNRFDRPGEGAFAARLLDRVCGVCGLNRDPFAGDAMVGRVRRMYVAVADRRRGVGSALLARVTEHARGVFHELRLRTDDPDAAAFYEANGFMRVDGDIDCTHRRRVPE